jgi:hypothetical protein
VLQGGDVDATIVMMVLPWLKGNATMVDGSATIVDINAAMVDGHECYKPKSRLLSLSCQGGRASRPVLLRDSR